MTDNQINHEITNLRGTEVHVFDISGVGYCKPNLPDDWLYEMVSAAMCQHGLKEVRMLIDQRMAVSRAIHFLKQNLMCITAFFDPELAGCSEEYHNYIGITIWIGV